jgi:hypothetical protein
MKSDLDIHDEVAAGFGRWRDLFERGLAAMRERGEPRRDDARGGGRNLNAGRHPAPTGPADNGV